MAFNGMHYTSGYELNPRAWQQRALSFTFYKTPRFQLFALAGENPSTRSDGAQTVLPRFNSLYLPCTGRLNSLKEVVVYAWEVIGRRAVQEAKEVYDLV